MKDPSKPEIISHSELQAYLGRYSGLMLYLREMDELVYGRICGVMIFIISTNHYLTFFLQAYLSAASDLHNVQIKALLSAYMDLVKKATEEEIEQGESERKYNILNKQQINLKRRINNNHKDWHVAPRWYR